MTYPIQGQISSKMVITWEEISKAFYYLNRFFSKSFMKCLSLWISTPDSKVSEENESFRRLALVIDLTDKVHFDVEYSSITYGNKKEVNRKKNSCCSSWTIFLTDCEVTCFTYFSQWWCFHHYKFIDPVTALVRSTTNRYQSSCFWKFNGSFLQFSRQFL
jgi:hypothetical protein